MIRIFLGNVGSGKTVTAVREMVLDDYRKTFTNIKTGIKHQVNINASMIIKAEIVDHKLNKKTGENEPVYKYTLNKEYWQKVSETEKHGINVTLDEAHSIINARRGMTKVNMIMTDWLALLRRILGETDSGTGNLTLISQLSNRIDIVARDMATQVRFHICHYFKRCNRCNYVCQENSEMPEPISSCPICANKKLIRFSHAIEVYHFRNMEAYLEWRMTGAKTFHKRYLIRDIEKYFHLYNTLQWDNMFTEFY